MKHILIVTVLALASDGTLATSPDEQRDPDHDLVRASIELDVDALTSFAHSSPRSHTVLAARGMLAALHGEDAVAIRMLADAAANLHTSRELRYEVLQTLAGVFHRDARFTDAAAALRASRALGVTESAEDAESTERALANERALAGAEPMSARVSAQGAARISRNVLDLPTAEVMV